jgi:hypothetical protein
MPPDGPPPIRLQGLSRTVTVTAMEFNTKANGEAMTECTRGE